MWQTKQRTNKLRYILYIAPILTLSFITHNTSALDYQSNTNIEFTFNPTISISISGNLSIDNLSPGTAKDSNIVDVVVATNNVSGYSLSATVGTNATNDRLTNINNSSYYFTNLSSNVSDTTSFNDNTWGYSYSTDNGANWISGSIGNTLAGYNGLPLDTNTTTNNNSAPELGKGGITLIDTYNAVDSKSIKFKIGARASSTQASGTYNNTINFYAIAHDSPRTFQEAYIAEGKQLYNGYYTMQDMTSTICDVVDQDSVIQLVDVRDGQLYWVGKAKDDNCWMLQNLKLGKYSETMALTSDTSDVGNNGFTINGKLSDGKFHAHTIDNIPSQNNSSEYYCADDYGCYYNWYTATAGSGTTYIEEGDASYSVCPHNWSLPTNEQFNVLRSRYSAASMLIDNPTVATENTNGKIPGFLLSGYYNSDGENLLNSSGRYSSRTAYGKQFTLGLRTDIDESSDTYGSKYIGFAIRCLAK